MINFDSSSPSSSPKLARFVGCLLGGALGDALGYPIEFNQSGASIMASFGATAPKELCFHDAAGGLVSDDTQMTLFSVEGLIRARLAGAANPESFVLAAYQRWYGTQAMRAGGPAVVLRGHGLLLADARLHARRAPGNTCLSALAQSLLGRPRPTLESPPNGSKGCGAVMRSAPFGLAASSREAAFVHARDAGVLTHGHPSGYLSAAYFAALVFDVARDMPLTEAMFKADALLLQEAGHQETRAILGTTLQLAQRGVPSFQDIERLGGGWTGEEALAIALLCVLTCEGSSEGPVAQTLWRSVAHGGDSDSTGSLVGNLLGALYGPEVFPSRWRAQLEMTDLIDRLARDLCAVCTGTEEIDRSAYPVQTQSL